MSATQSWIGRFASIVGFAYRRWSKVGIENQKKIKFIDEAIETLEKSINLLSNNTVFAISETFNNTLLNSDLKNDFKTAKISPDFTIEVKNTANKAANAVSDVINRVDAATSYSDSSINLNAKRKTNYGEEKKAFLPFDEIHPSYFRIPTGDKEINKESSDAEVNSIDDEKASKKNFLDFYRKYKIQDVIKKDQVLLIQIIKEERGSKGAAVSTFVSLPGRYCVLLPNNSASGGVSKKISNPTDRKRLKQIHEKLNLPDGMSLIIRTNAIGSDSNDINGDFEYLKKLWTEVRSNTLKSKAPKLIYELDSPLIKIIRDVYNKSYSEILNIVSQGLISHSSVKMLGIFAANFLIKIHILDLGLVQMMHKISWLILGLSA